MEKRIAMKMAECGSIKPGYKKNKVEEGTQYCEYVQEEQQILVLIAILLEKDAINTSKIYSLLHL